MQLLCNFAATKAGLAADVVVRYGSDVSRESPSDVG